MLYWSPLMSAIITRVIRRIIARDTTSTKSYIVPSFTTILHGKRIRHSPYDHRMVSAAASGAMSNHVFAVQVSVQVAIQFLAVQSPVTTAVALQSGIIVMRKAQDNFPFSDLFFSLKQRIGVIRCNFRFNFSQVSAAALSAFDMFPIIDCSK